MNGIEQKDMVTVKIIMEMVTYTRENLNMEIMMEKGNIYGLIINQSIKEIF